MSRKRFVWYVGGAAGLYWCAVPAAQAADLRWSAPVDCPEQSALEAEIEHSIGLPLAAVDGVDFDVTIERQSQHKWRLKLATRTPGGGVRERELSGQSCADVSAAAVLAIGLTIANRSAADGGGDPAPEISEPEAVSTDADSAAPGGPAAEQLPAVAGEPERAQPSAPAMPLEFSAAALVVLDTALLPFAGPGASLELALRYGAFKAIAVGAIFAEQSTRLDTERGGRFGLALIGGLLCLQPSAADLVMLGCAGFELGRMSAEGIAATRLRGSATLRALRVDFGGGYRFTQRLAAFARLGVSAPLASAEFLIDNNADQPVHRLGSLSLRALAGIELFL